jgi:hypothetical protein
MNLRICETVTRNAVLGVRAVDLATDEPVTDGLSVSAQPLDSDATPRRGRPTGASVFAFSGLSGLMEYEFPPLEPEHPANLTDAQAAAPSPGAPFGVLVDDLSGRFLDIGVETTPPNSDILEIPLPSTPARPGVAGRVAIRGSLRLDDAQRSAAAFAVIEARLDGARPDEYYLGISDANGGFVVFIPLPAPTWETTGSPPDSAPSAPLHERTVGASLSFRHQPDRQRFLVTQPDGQTTSILGATGGVSVGRLPRGAVSRPELSSVISSQSASMVYQNLSDAPRNSFRLQIPFGFDAVARTTGGDSFIVLAS